MSQVQEILERVEKYIPEETDETLLAQLVNDALDYIKSYTLRTTVPEELNQTAGDIAIITYNRRGTEGEKSRSEGGESYSFEELPATVFNVLNRYRLVKVGGRTYEAETDES